MKTIKTKIGTIYLAKDTNSKGGWVILDSEKRELWFCVNKKEAKNFIKTLNKFESVSQWLKTEEYGDCCWGSMSDIMFFAKDYQECNNRKFDKEWFEANWNKLGNTFILFGYSDCYL